MKAPIKQILVSNGRRHVPLGGYASPSAKSWLYKDLDFWPSGRRPLCIANLFIWNFHYLYEVLNEWICIMEAILDSLQKFLKHSLLLDADIAR